MTPVLRDATPADFDAIVALNRAEEHRTSPMDRARLTLLHGLAHRHRVACVSGTVGAFLLAMRDGAAYENANYAWFASRYPRFVYVDRIVVSADCRRLRLASLLYEELFRDARAEASECIACEYDVLPPNEASRAFHDRFGFREAGRQWLGAKCVSLQVASLAPGVPTGADARSGAGRGREVE